MSSRCFNRFVPKSASPLSRQSPRIGRIEFALVAPVFFALLFAILETALMFFASQVLETSRRIPPAMVLTGQAQMASYDPGQFQRPMSAREIPALFTCANVYVDVESYTSFSDRGGHQPYQRSGNFDRQLAV